MGVHGWREGAGHKFFGPNNATDLWHVKKIPPQQLEHLTGKPAELAVMAMQYSSRKGDKVLDLFGGSGSTPMLERSPTVIFAAARNFERWDCGNTASIQCDIASRQSSNEHRLETSTHSPSSHFPDNGSAKRGLMTQMLLDVESTSEESLHLRE